jgi:ATP-dependent DNA helicase RecG
LMPDALQELIAGARGPLLFLRDATPEKRARIRLPVQAWLGTIAGLGGDDAGLGDLARGLQALETTGAGELAAAAANCLVALDALGSGSASVSSSVPKRASGPTKVPTAQRKAKLETKPASGAVGEVVEAVPAAVVAPGDRQPLKVGAWYEAMAASPVTLDGVGPKRETELAKFGLETVEDILYHLPFRYEDRRQIATTRELRAGETLTLALRIRHLDERAVGRSRRRILTVVASDEEGSLEMIWYHQIRWFSARLTEGSHWLVHGKVEAGYGSFLRMVHPEIESLDAAEDVAPAGLVPVYEKPTAMPAQVMRRIVGSAVARYAPQMPDVVPEAVRERFELPELAAAFAQVHAPEPELDPQALAEMHSPGHRAIVFDELFLVQLGLLLRKGAVQATPGIAFVEDGGLAERMIAALPFELTGAQQRVIAEISKDMAAPHPMHRLVQGDVGSGKTLVAVAAALRAIENGHQAAIMAPTELLAEQHWQTVHRVAEGLGVNLHYLSGEVGAAERGAILPALASGEPALVVGTHALIQEEVRFGRLGLAVIDEQHRFGVMQRAALGREDEAGPAPDVLLMTATPIPRTMALSVYGDLDLSTIDELPPGRKPIQTEVISSRSRERAYAKISTEVAAGHQAYVVYPLIEESEKSDLRDASTAAGELRERFPEMAIALIHGRIPAAEREEIMRAFQAGEYQILVATTVIEVGIDVANATLMIIEHAERFGLSQLHQLRGRVGRGADESSCLLVAEFAQSKEARERLRVMTETGDGLRIAEADLAIRGPGAMLGTRQSGLPDFRVANLLRDQALLRQARDAAAAILRADPRLDSEAARPLRVALEARWAGRLGLARVG